MYWSVSTVDLVLNPSIIQSNVVLYFASNILEYHQNGSLEDLLCNKLPSTTNNLLLTLPWIFSLKQQLAFEVSLANYF